MIVFDASTLILLAKVDLLEQITNEHEVIITDIVKQESATRDLPDAGLTARLVDEDRIAIKQVQDGAKDIKRLQKDFNIDKGEASSLWLARRLHTIIATDDGLAIKAAKILGIGFTTAIQFLILSYQNGTITRNLALAKLEKLERLGRYHKSIIEDAKIKLQQWSLKLRLSTDPPRVVRKGGNLTIMPVLSVRLDDKDFERLKELASKEKKDQSTLARELIIYGWNYMMVQRYREGKLSLGKLAKQLGISLSETIDLLADMGVEAPIDYDDYLKGYETLRRVTK